MSSTPELAARLDSPGRVRSGLGSPSDNAIDDEECEPSVGIENMSKRFGQREMGLALKGPIQQIIAFPFVPEMRPLTIQDIDSCIALENASFDEHYRCTPEKFEYRLTTCPEITLGLFANVPLDWARELGLATLSGARPAEKGLRADDNAALVSMLFAHIVSTRSNSSIVTDDDMKLPASWKRRSADAPPADGPRHGGRTVCLHSLAVLPYVQRCGLGRRLLDAYLQQIRYAAETSRVALLCQQHLVKFYENVGFRNLGESKATFGGGGWFDMVIDFPDVSQSE